MKNKLCNSEIILFKAEKNLQSQKSSEQKERIVPPDNNLQFISAIPIKIIKIDTTHEQIITHTKEITQQIIELTSS